MRELRNEVGEEIKECCICNPPRRLFCWNGLETPVERDVSAVALCRFGFVAVTFDGEMFSHCATIGKSKDLKGGEVMANANEFVITEHKCEMCKSYGPSAECTMNIEGKVIARFWLCIGCQKEMLETYKDVLNKPLTAK